MRQHIHTEQGHGSRRGPFGKVRLNKGREEIKEGNWGLNVNILYVLFFVRYEYLSKIMNKERWLDKIAWVF